MLVTEGAIAGGTAGVVVETALYPIDTIKTRLQVNGSPCCWYLNWSISYARLIDHWIVTEVVSNIDFPAFNSRTIIL